jgi:hypothetical protein
MIRHPVKSKASPWHDEPRPPVLTHKIFALPGRLTQLCPLLAGRWASLLDLLHRELELPVQGLVRRSKSGKEYNNRKIVVYPENRFLLIFTCGYGEAAVNFILWRSSCPAFLLFSASSSRAQF